MLALLFGVGCAPEAAGQSRVRRQTLSLGDLSKKGDRAVKESEVVEYWAWGQGRGSICDQECVRKP